MENAVFSGNMKLAGLISANHSLILMLPRFGIPLGFGDGSVSDICRKHNVSEDFFLLVCNVYTFDTYRPDKEELCGMDMSLLVPYLLASHRYYLKERLPHIEHHLQKIANHAAAKYGDMLMRFFDGYKQEVFAHFNYEEHTVFPYIGRLLNGTMSETYHIRDFAKSHSDVEDKLNDLTQILFKYLPGNVLPDESIEVVFDIFQLSADLNKHTLIEEKILVPYVEMLEKGSAG